METKHYALTVNRRQFVKTTALSAAALSVLSRGTAIAQTVSGGTVVVPLVQGFPAGQFSSGSLLAKIDGWNAHLKIGSNPISGVAQSVKVTGVVQTWHDSNPTGTLRSHLTVDLTGATSNGVSLLSSAVYTPANTSKGFSGFLLQTFKNPASPKIGEAYTVSDYLLNVKITETKGLFPDRHLVQIEVTIVRETLENCTDELIQTDPTVTTSTQREERFGGKELAPISKGFSRILKVQVKQ